MPIAAIDANISMTKKEIRDFSFTFSDRIRTFLFMLTVRFTFARSFIERVVLFKQVNHCEPDKKTREHNGKVENKFYALKPRKQHIYSAQNYRGQQERNNSVYSKFGEEIGNTPEDCGINNKAE